VQPLVAKKTRVCGWDRPGYGFSNGGYVPFDRQLEAIHELLEKLHVRRPILVGHSYGGTISLGFAERYPSQVRGLVLVDAAAGGLQVESLEEVQAHAVQFLQLPVIRQIANATFAQLFATLSVNSGDSEAFHPEPVVQAHRDRVLAINMAHGDLEAFAGEALAANGVIDQIDGKLGTIRAPAVVIQGEDDELVEATHGRRLADDLPNSRLVMVYGGHMQPYDHPAVIARAVQSIGEIPELQGPSSDPSLAKRGDRARELANSGGDSGPDLDAVPRVGLTHRRSPLFPSPATSARVTGLLRARLAE